LPLLTYYKNKGWDIKDFPNAWAQYENEISLPVYFDLSNESVVFVAQSIIEAFHAL